MRCLIGVKTPNGEGGSFFFINDFDGDPEDLIGIVQAYSDLPAEHKPDTFPYENTIMLGAMAAISESEWAFELGLEDGKPTLAVIEVCFVEMPPDTPPFMVQMKRAANDFSE